MHKPFGNLTVILVPGMTLFAACTNGAPTASRPDSESSSASTLPPAQSPRTTSASSAGARPAGAPRFINPDQYGVYNTNLKWMFKSGGQIRAMPAVSGKTVYVGSDDGRMYALE